jgi:hypothetical protein
MKTIDELTTEFKPYYPKFLFKLLGFAEYKKNFNIFGIKTNTKAVVIAIYMLITIIMIISYEMNSSQTTTLVWIGFWLWVIFILINLVCMGFIFYNNFRIKKLCKKYGYTIQDWNNSALFQKINKKLKL